MTLKELEIGKSAVIRTVGGSGELRKDYIVQPVDWLQSACG